MASTNKTAHYEFPQYIGSDIPNILTDINPAFETIDTALYEQGQQIAEQTTDLSDIQEAVNQATADVAVMQSSIVSMAGIVETTRQLATDNKETIGQGTLDTTAQTLIGGVNELKDNIDKGSVGVDLDNDTYGSMITKLNALIDWTKVRPESYITVASASGIEMVFHLSSSVNKWFTYSLATGTGCGIYVLRFSDDTAYSAIGAAYTAITTDTVSATRAELVY